MKTALGEISGWREANSTSVEMSLFERVKREHVLDRRHPATQALERAKQCASAYFFHRARWVLRRQRVKAPAFERHFLQRAFGQYVVGVVVGVDEARQDEMPARVDLIDRCVCDSSKP